MSRVFYDSDPQSTRAPLPDRPGCAPAARRDRPRVRPQRVPASVADAVRRGRHGLFSPPTIPSSPESPSSGPTPGSSARRVTSATPARRPAASRGMTPGTPTATGSLGPVLGELLASLRHEDLTGLPQVQVKVLGREITPRVPTTAIREAWHKSSSIRPGGVPRGLHLGPATMATIPDNQSSPLRRLRLPRQPSVARPDGRRATLLRTPRSAASAISSPSEAARRRRQSFEAATTGSTSSGLRQGKVVGVAVLDHPANSSRFPQPVCLHANKPISCFAPDDRRRLPRSRSAIPTSRVTACSSTTAHPTRPPSSAPGTTTLSRRKRR